MTCGFSKGSMSAGYYGYANISTAILHLLALGSFAAL